MVAHNVIRIQGTMPGGEVWSVNPRYWDPVGGIILDYDALEAWAQSVGEYIAGLGTTNTMRNQVSTAAAITSIRAEAIGGDGTMTQAAEYTLPSPVPGTSVASKPYQSAVVCSLLTGRPGRSYRGRLYWPALGTPINTQTLRLEPALVQAIANGMATILTNIGDLAPGETSMGPVVVSQTLGVATPVNAVSVGDVLDTQRRRRDSLAEQRAVAAVPRVAP